MQKIADGDDYKTPATIDDAGALTEVREALKQVGYAKNHERHLTEELNRPRVAQG
jgi:propionyl-CoA synthetase